jgi:ankyrin repeat protein
MPREQQLRDYDNELVFAIRNNDLVTLTRLYQGGRDMTACNTYSESIVHMACRRSNINIVSFLLTHGADLSILDDFGRNPLHDACWRVEPVFGIITMLLDRNLELIRQRDKRGYIPLQYVRDEHHLMWCAYLYNMIEKYWAPIVPSSNNNNNNNSQTVLLPSAPLPQSIETTTAATTQTNSESQQQPILLETTITTTPSQDHDEDSNNNDNDEHQQKRRRH